MAKEILTLYGYIEKRINNYARQSSYIVQDLLGDIKHDIEYDKGITKDMTAQEIVNHIRLRACVECLEALEKLVNSYKKYCRNLGLGYEKVSCRN